MARKPYVGGNWKMNLDGTQAMALTKALMAGFQHRGKVDVAICPPFVYLERVHAALASAGGTSGGGGGGGIMLGAQDCYHEPNGAYTGEVSLAMLREVGVAVVLTGHSERRHVIGESDVLINAKTRAALAAGLEVILCVGEKIEQREAGQTDAVNAAQTHYGLAGVSRNQMARVTIAYEPVWAIGTGKTATPEDAQNAHQAIRQVLGHIFGDKVAQATRIQYGGSVKPDNAAELASKPDIDGFLVGGASLKVDAFLPILDAAAGAVTVGR